MGDARVFDWPGVAARIFLPPGPLSGRRGPASREIYFAGQTWNANRNQTKETKGETSYASRMLTSHEIPRHTFSILCMNGECQWPETVRTATSP